MTKFNEKIVDVFMVIFDPKEWWTFVKRFFMLGVVAFIAFILWMTIVSAFVAPFYSVTKSGPETITIYKDVEGKSTIMSIRDGMQSLLDEGLVTNYLGVRTWIDNRQFEQIGEIEIMRVCVNGLENYLGRNRGTSGANKHLVQARAHVYSDYELPFFTSYSTRLKQSIDEIDLYVEQLEKDQNVSMSAKTAMFIVNSDNLAEALERMKQQLQTNLVGKTTLTTEDDKFYRIRGNMIAMHRFLQGIDEDFKEKLVDKTSYEENFVPIMEALETAINNNHFIVLEWFGHVSKIEKEANIITQKMAELRNKLHNG